MRIHRTPPRREIKQLQAHRKNNPRDNQTRPSRPHPFSLLISAHTKPTPDQILHNAHCNIGSHVVGVIEAPETEHTRMFGCFLVEAEDAHHRQEKARKVSGVEDTAEDPARKAKVSKAQIESPQRVARRVLACLGTGRRAICRGIGGLVREGRVRAYRSRDRRSCHYSSSQCVVAKMHVCVSGMLRSLLRFGIETCRGLGRVQQISYQKGVH
ncbi:hypothetical protein KCU62_g393, partial [Aureobasidium sp. EXF-3399]